MSWTQQNDRIPHKEQHFQKCVSGLLSRGFNIENVRFSGGSTQRELLKWLSNVVYEHFGQCWNFMKMSKSQKQWNSVVSLYVFKYHEHVEILWTCSHMKRRDNQSPPRTTRRIPKAKPWYIHKPMGFNKPLRGPVGPAAGPASLGAPIGLPDLKLHYLWLQNQILLWLRMRSGVQRTALS